MLLGAFLPGLRRLYSLQEYVSALMLVAGLIIFTLADAASSPNFQVLGVVMVCTALLLDAILGNMQESIFAVNPTTSQVSGKLPPCSRRFDRWVMAQTRG
jgi:adenosine 3'-phospho 5'-phosphosulfate transporter B3